MSKQAFLKTAVYMLVTMLIGVVSQLDELKFDFINISTSAWAGIIIKSTLPGLMTIKALFDFPTDTNSNG